MTKFGGTNMGVPQIGPQKFKLFYHLSKPYERLEIERKDKLMTNFNCHKLGCPPQIYLSNVLTT